MLSPSLESSLVRVLTDDQEPRRPVGAGFMVTPKHVLTCAHVVNAALRRNEYAIDPPDAEVFLDFPLLNNQSLLRAKILHWFPVADDSATGTTDKPEDIAVLELLPETPLPNKALPAPLVALDSAASFADHRLRMCGFPGSVDQGTHIDGILKGRTGAGSWEIHPLDKIRPIEQGFSGTAVWAVQENAVCGMISSRLRRKPDQENGPVITGYMLPASALIRAFPELDQHSRPANPYRGLEAFREKDADLYFGRDQTITRLKQVVADRPFAAVIGASGSGKSSVVFAGLLPALRKSGDWLIAHCRPKKQPLYELSACLIPLLYDDPILRSEKTDELKEKLHAGSVGLVGIIRQIKERREQHENLHLLLVIDQFEELFTLNTDQELIRQYIGILLECLHTEQFTVLLTMRADFFAAAVSSSALAEALDHSAPIILPQIDEQGLREVVEQPANVLGVYFEPGLTDLIVSDVGKEPGSLPLLEFCLTQLWERQEFRRISHEAYKAIGGVQQALANHADAVYAEFDEQEREQLRHIFLKLVRPGQGTEDTRQVATVGQIAAEDRALITRLADKRLIVTGRDEEREEETVEVVHEALIRRWQTLRQWVDEEREFLVWQEKLRVLLGQWLESDKDEGALLRGLPLDEALRWSQGHKKYLGSKERNFIKASKQFRKREKKAKATVYKEQKKLFFEASYNLAKVFEQKSLHTLKKGNPLSSRQALLFASAALRQNIKANKYTLEKASIAYLFAPKVFSIAFAEQWCSSVDTAHHGPVTSISFSPNGKKLASASIDRTVRLWSIKTGKILTSFIGHNDFVWGVTFSPDGKKLASASSDKTIRLWDISSKTEPKLLTGHTASIWSIAFSPDGKRLASASSDNTIRLWDVEEGRELKVFTGHTASVRSVTFSPNGNKLASVSFDKTLRLLDIKSGKENVFRNHEGVFISLSFSPDGKRLALASSNNTVQLWNIEKEKKPKVLLRHTDTIWSVAFRTDGKTLAFASSDGTVRWIQNGIVYSPQNILLGFAKNIPAVSTPRRQTVFTGHTDCVRSVAFSPDGHLLASASDDRSIRLWETLETEQKVDISLFLHNSNPTPLYHTFIEVLKFLWQLDVQGLEIVETERRSPADLKKYGTLLAPPPPGQSKFDQVLEWAEKQQEL